MSKRNAIDQLLGNRKSTGIQNPVNTSIQVPINEEKQEPVFAGMHEPIKKKATFDFDPQFHTKLKMFAAELNKPMVDVVVEAVKIYMDRYKEC